MSINKTAIENMIKEHAMKKDEASTMASMWWKIERKHNDMIEQLTSLIEDKEQNNE